jgi:predicted RNA-binding protein associated with RNAse of E/G family
MDEDDLPTLVFSGQISEATFLKSLLESRGIETSIETGLFTPVPKLYVRRRDAQNAVAVVEEFLRNGKRTTS